MSDFAASLDETLITRQSWCTCKTPYYCNGDELVMSTDVPTPVADEIKRLNEQVWFLTKAVQKLLHDRYLNDDPGEAEWSALGYRVSQYLDHSPTPVVENE